VLGVPESGFHAWRHRRASAHATGDAALLKRIRTIHASSRETYAYSLDAQLPVEPQVENPRILMPVSLHRRGMVWSVTAFA
jgi:hypothetical protein